MSLRTQPQLLLALGRKHLGRMQKRIPLLLCMELQVTVELKLKLRTTNTLGISTRVLPLGIRS